MRAFLFTRILFGIYLWSLSDASKYILRKTPIFELKGPSKVLHISGKTIAEVVTANNGTTLFCRLHEVEEEEDAEDAAKKSQLPVKHSSFKGMMNLIKECNKFPKVDESGITTMNTEMNAEGWNIFWKGILPGTKWCGMGDVASSFDDLGEQNEVDRCCRAHDLCPIKLKSFRSGYGLVNYSFYTKSHCDCDDGLYNCLKDTKNQVADTIGNLYFNVLQTQCLKHRQSFICIQNRTYVDGSENCIQWGVDLNTNQMQNSVPLARY